MSKFQQMLPADMHQVMLVLAVEQILINLSGLNIDRTGATFRRMWETIVTVFHLTIPDNNNLDIFTDYYSKHFENLIIRQYSIKAAA